MLAAALGAAMGIAAGGLGGMLRKDSDAAIAVVRLTTAVEHIAGEVSLLRTEIKEDARELYPRLNTIEQRLSTIEARI